MIVQFGENLRSERKRLGLTQEQLAAHLGTTLKTQSLYERGQSSPNAEYLLGFARLGGDLTFVFTGKATPAVSETLPKREHDLLNSFRKLTDEDKESLERLLAGLLALPK